MTFQRFAFSLIVAATAALSMAPAQAATTVSGNFNVNLKVVPKCVFGTGTIANIDLGSADASTSGLTTNAGSTTFNIQCTKRTAYTINLSPTNTVAGADNTGKLNASTDATQQVDYALFSDAAYKNAWGKTTAVSDTATSSALKSYTVYARVTSVGDVIQDNYSDKVTITVTY